MTTRPARAASKQGDQRPQIGRVQTVAAGELGAEQVEFDGQPAQQVDQPHRVPRFVLTAVHLTAHPVLHPAVLSPARHDGPALGGVPGLPAWLDAVLDGPGVTEADLCGHSYGTWIALEYALHAPARVGRPAPLDPAQCFAGFRPGYPLRALPLFLPPRSAARARS
ncbi:alpha/beta fold hydrolase [Kitasatospora sp. NPDC092286]|uniref:alpha/beta fold hydrolase n=1 Tax=Kitasatospora sp. NPDC092286 TaxID=3364087 RepID=UPI0038152892